MRNRFRHLVPVARHLGSLLLLLGGVLLAPVVVLELYAWAGQAEVSPLCFIGPSAAAFALGLAMRLATRGRRWPLGDRGAMLVCALGWVCLSAVGALPFVFGLGTGFLDAYFETVSGFTTTGITMLRGLDGMPRSILFWRALTQWLGGLGILTFFLAVVGAGGGSHRLFSAESHKVFTRRPAPGLFHTLRILWAIYTAFTLLIVGLLMLAGMGAFDAVTHSFTCLSTAGYSPYDASIGHYARAAPAHAAAIQYVLIVGMVLGGTNFFIHYRVLTGELRALWDNLEVRLWWLLLLGATALVVLDRWLRWGAADLHELVRSSLFQVVSIATTTGFATQDIASGDYPALSKQVLLVLMVVGACAGSTGGGVKVLRIGVLLRMLGSQLRRAIWGSSAVEMVLVDGEVVAEEEMRRVGALFFAWMALLAVGGGVTALLSELGPLQSASGMFSALGNIGPCYIPVERMAALHPLIKLTYIVGMLAGRLEVLPVLMLLSPRAWK